VKLKHLVLQSDTGFSNMCPHGISNYESFNDQFHFSAFLMLSELRRLEFTNFGKWILYNSARL